MEIPVTFLHGQTEVHGVLKSVIGAGAEATMFHLTVNNFYWAQLIYASDKNKWFLHPQNRPGLEVLADYFAECIKAAKP